MSDVGNLEEEARKRREKLKNLKKSSNSSEPPSKKRAEESNEALPKPMFRSYVPKDESLKESQIEKVMPVEVSEHVTDQLEATVPKPVVEEVDLVNLAPRKPDWDLKRDLSKKLEKLERRTKRAIADLIRERLQSGDTDIITAVSDGPGVEMTADDD